MADYDDVRSVRFRPKQVDDRAKETIRMSDEVRHIQFGPKKAEDDDQFEFIDQHGNVVTRFTSQAQVTAAMKDERYETDPSYRRQVILMVHNSDVNEINLGQLREDSGRDAEELDIQKDIARRMFNHPDYKTSPIFRREVENFIAANSPNDNVSSHPSDVVRVAFGTDPTGPKLTNPGRTLQIAVEPKITGPTKPGNGQK
jgi:hypothetical protein